MFKLRCYQEEGVQACLEYIESESKKFPLVISPTGGGKSLYISSLASRLHQVLLIIQPNITLLNQNIQKLRSYGKEASIYSASLNKKDIGNITFATIGSVKKEIAYFSKYKPIILVDEAHMSSKKAGELAKFVEAIGATKVIGFTATPFELKNTMSGAELLMTNRSRKNMFNDIIHVTQIQELVDNGFWAPIVYDVRQVSTNKLVLNSTHQDFTQESIQAHYKSNGLAAKIKEAVKYALDEDNRKAVLIFVSNINEAEELHKEIPGSAVMHSKLSKKVQKQVVDGFRDRSIKVVINVNMLSVGADFDFLDCLILGRATSSITISYQQMGRGVRPHPNKENCLIIDFAGNIERFGKLETLEFRETRGLWGLYQGAKKLTRGEEYAPMKRSDLFTFGKYLGIPISEVPREYLIAFVGEYKKEDELKKKIVECLGK